MPCLKKYLWFSFRPACKAVCNTGGGRMEWENHYDRQARGTILRPGNLFCWCCRYIPGGGCRSADDLERKNWRGNRKKGNDPASVAFDTVSSGVARGVDVILIDTAPFAQQNAPDGAKWQDKAGDTENILEAPHEVMLRFDGSTGQNALE